MSSRTTIRKRIGTRKPYMTILSSLCSSRDSLKEVRKRIPFTFKDMSTSNTLLEYQESRKNLEESIHMLSHEKARMKTLYDMFIKRKLAVKDQYLLKLESLQLKENGPTSQDLRASSVMEDLSSNVSSPTLHQPLDTVVGSSGLSPCNFVEGTPPPDVSTSGEHPVLEKAERLGRWWSRRTKSTQSPLRPDLRSGSMDTIHLSTSSC